MEKFEEVQRKGVQYIIMKIDEIESPVPVLELETVGEFSMRTIIIKYF